MGSRKNSTKSSLAQVQAQAMVKSVSFVGREQRRPRSDATTPNRGIHSDGIIHRVLIFNFLKAYRTRGRTG